MASASAFLRTLLSVLARDFRWFIWLTFRLSPITGLEWGLFLGITSFVNFVIARLIFSNPLQQSAIFFSVAFLAIQPLPFLYMAWIGWIILRVVNYGSPPTTNRLAVSETASPIAADSTPITGGVSNGLNTTSSFEPSGKTATS